MLEKLDACPTCGSKLDQVEYDFQFCRSCASTMGFHKPEAIVPFSAAYPAPWRIQLDEVVDRHGCHVNAFDASDGDQVEFWRGVVDAVNAKSTATALPAGDGPGALVAGDQDVLANEAPGPCRECGIEQIEPGTEIDGEPLCWMDSDLCSHCHDRLQADLVEAAARYWYLRDRPTSAAAIAAGGVFGGMIPDNLILGGEDLDRAVDAARGQAVRDLPTLETRLADCLADCIDTPLMTGRDEVGSFTSPLEIRLGFFKPDISERAAALLEEAGR